MLKTKERIRRNKRMTELVKSGTFPYTPTILSWLSIQLDKPSAKIVPADIEALLKTP